MHYIACLLLRPSHQGPGRYKYNQMSSEMIDAGSLKLQTISTDKRFNKILTWWNKVEGMPIHESHRNRNWWWGLKLCDGALKQAWMNSSLTSVHKCRPKGVKQSGHLNYVEWLLDLFLIPTLMSNYIYQNECGELLILSQTSTLKFGNG